MSLQEELRRAADEFTLVVAVIADKYGRTPYDVATEALGDSLARLTESGALSSDPDPDDE